MTIQVGMMFGHLRVVQVLTGSEAGRPRGAQHAMCRCACGKRVLWRSRHLRAQQKLGFKSSCGCQSPFRPRVFA